MARLPAVTRDQLAPEDHQYFDSIVGTRGSIRGPYGVLLHSPKLAARVADTGAFVRFDFGIPVGTYGDCWDRYYVRVEEMRQSALMTLDALNKIPLGGFQLGFWMAQQGSIYVFVVLIFVYVQLMNKLDQKYGFDKEDEPAPDPSPNEKEDA